MNKPNILLHKTKSTAGQKVSQLANDYPVITTLAVVTVLVGLAVLLVKTKNHADADSGRYTEFDTSY